MERDSVGIVLASVLAGLAVLLAVAALARQPFLLVVAVPFAAGAYLVWCGATGKFAFGFAGGRRVAEREAGRAQRERERRGGPFTDRRSRFAGARAQSRGRDGRSRRRGASRNAAERPPERLERRQAYRVLGLRPDADADAVKAAYRERVKRTHPDADGGDSEAFQRVNAAYETLRE